VRLDVRFGADRTQLVVQDDGRGFDPVAVSRMREEGRRLGLVGMRERTELIGGTFEMDTRPGRGTRLTVSIPHEGATTSPSAESPHG
jgi:signal transduction histidine kinase